MGWYIHWYTGDIWGVYQSRMEAKEDAEKHAASTWHYKVRWHMLKPKNVEGVA
jgi:hypothetical protein